MNKRRRFKAKSRRADRKALRDADNESSGFHGQPHRRGLQVFTQDDIDELTRIYGLKYAENL
jgi:hypothetical protein